MPSATTLLIASVVGHCIGLLILWLVRRYANHYRGMLDVVTDAIDKKKGKVAELGDPADAMLIRHLTAAIADGMRDKGLTDRFDKALHKSGRNKVETLRPIIRRMPPEVESEKAVEG